MTTEGRKIGPYRLDALIGRGGMGEVWRAHDSRLARDVAIKLVSAGTRDPETRARMRREAKAAAAINHPNVVTLHDVISDGDGDFLVMELVDGITLADRARAGPVPPAEVAHALGAVADALASAHAIGIFHRDVKSSNVMLTPRGVAKVLDFGLAKVREATAREVERASHAPVARAAGDDSATAAVDVALGDTMPHADLELTRDGARVGTPQYMAPEQMRSGAFDGRSEIYAVGVIAYELLAGRCPFRASSWPELYHEVTTVAPPALDGVPRALRAVVERALAKSPADRFQTMTELRDALRAAELELTAPVLAPPARRLRTVPALLALALLLAAGGVLAIALRSRDAGPPERPGDRYVERALEEYDLFYNDKAASSLRAAVTVDPSHPRAHAYLLLFGVADPSEARRAVVAGRRILSSRGDVAAKDLALLRAAVTLADRGPAVARSSLRADAPGGDREIAFWLAELAYRAHDFDTAEREYEALLRSDVARFRGRIYDHASAVLLFEGRTMRAEQVGRLYAQAFPGEADAVGVHASTLAVMGRFDEAFARAREALALHESEDTLAGLGKVEALRGNLAAARGNYERSLARAEAPRRPLRRAALGVLWLVDGDRQRAAAAVAPCLDGGEDAGARERGACLFVAGLAEPVRIPALVLALERLASLATPAAPAYGDPHALARMLTARSILGPGGCIEAPEPAAARDYIAPARAAEARASLAGARDFYATYHVPFLDTWAACASAALAEAEGEPRDAARALERALESYPRRGLVLLELGRVASKFDRDRARAALGALGAAWPTLAPASGPAGRAAELEAQLGTASGQ